MYHSFCSSVLILSRYWTASRPTDARGSSACRLCLAPFFEAKKPEPGDWILLGILWWVEMSVQLRSKKASPPSSAFLCYRYGVQPRMLPALHTARNWGQLPGG